jgi:UDP-glucuronate 4-epimerase
MTFLVTGAAGFIGYHVALRLLERGDRVLGLDNLCAYYDVSLKRARLQGLAGHRGFAFAQADIADLPAVQAAVAGRGVRRVIHLAAQAGVRHSIEDPASFVSSNLVGHANMLELCRRSDGIEAMVYASSSSVYGGGRKLPYAEEDRVDAPISLYAATKKADELMSYAYSHLYGLKLTGLRFFTVYGPFGRPDMAMWLFAEAILRGEPIKVFNHGRMKRDFTYVDDIVAGVLKVADAPPAGAEGPPHRVYNVGAERPEELDHMIGVLEEAIGRRAERILLPMQPGDVPATYADIGAMRRDFGFEPTTTLEQGVPAFVRWLKAYRGLS